MFGAPRVVTRLGRRHASRVSSEHGMGVVLAVQNLYDSLSARLKREFSRWR